MALDLNHGSGASTKPPTLGDSINDLIDAAIFARRAKQPARNYLGASLLGDPCLRKLCYSYMHTPKDRDFSAQVLRIFDIGHGSEDFLAGEMESTAIFKEAAARWLHDAGFDLRAKKSDGEQFGWEGLGGRVQGHVDGIIVSGPALQSMVYPAIWECKALNMKNWNKIKKHGLRVGSEEYFGQTQLNMAYLDIPYTLFTALQKNDEQLHHELIILDALTAQQVSDKSVAVIRASESGHLLPRIASHKDFYRCKWCDWRTTCWSEAE
jgi:hypothetical protein